MNRRKIIQAGATLATGISTGFLGTRQEGESDDETEEEAEVPCESDIQFGERELVIDESGTSSTAYAEVVVENLGEAASGEITVAVEWIDEDENLIDDDSTTLPSLGPGETWLAYVRAALINPDEIADFEVTGEFHVGYPRTPPGMSVGESDFDRGENEITGVAENNREEDIERIEAHGKIYAEDGTVLGGYSDSERDLPAGRDWRFVVGTPRLPAEVDPTDHDVMLDASTYLIPG